VSGSAASLLLLLLLLLSKDTLEASAAPEAGRNSECPGCGQRVQDGTAFGVSLSERGRQGRNPPFLSPNVQTRLQQHSPSFRAKPETAGIGLLQGDPGSAAWCHHSQRNECYNADQAQCTAGHPSARAMAQETEAVETCSLKWETLMLSEMGPTEQEKKAETEQPRS
jgi:hypothetical protein